MLLDQIDALGEKIDRLTTRVDELVEQIPEAADSCNGAVRSVAANVLDCDLILCGSTICPTVPPVIDSAAKYRFVVETAFRPTTDYTQMGYAPLLKCGSSDVTYDLPANLGKVSTSCHSSTALVDECDTISISPSVYVSRQ